MTQNSYSNPPAGEGESNFYKIIESKLDGVVILDQDGVIQFANDFAARLFDCKAENLVGTFFGYPILMGEQTEIEILPHQGARPPVLVEMSLVEINWQGKKAVMANLHDITRRMQMQRSIREANEQLTNILESISDGFFALNEKMEITYFNQASATLLGRHREEVLGKPFAEAFPEAVGSLFEERYARAIREKKPDSFEEFFGIAPYTNWYNVRVYPYQGGISVFFQVTTQQKMSEQQLRFQAYLLDSVGQAVIATDLEGKIIYWNKFAQTLYGWSSEEATGRNIVDVIAAQISLPIAEEIMHKLKQGEIWTGEIFVQNREGVVFPVFVCDEPLYDEQGNLKGIVGISTDISERRHSEEALRDSEERFRTLVESMQDIVFTLDCEERHTGVFGPWLQQFGVPGSLFLGKTAQEIMGEELAAIHHQANQRALKGEYVVYEWSADHQTGKLYFQTSLSPLRDRNAQIVGLVGIGRNITEIKQVEKRLAESLAEKESLLKEIHHRVKNNMQVISSLLNLQCDSTENAVVQEALKDSQSRVRSMALVHEKLYQSPNLSKVNFSEYIENLATYLYRSYRVKGGDITLDFELEEIFIDTETAVPLGLIVNELITNGLKHAFPDQSGEILIKLNKKDGQVFLVVQDNGVGISDELKTGKPGSLGLQLVNDLTTKQLSGKLDVKVNAGTCFMVRVPVEE